MVHFAWTANISFGLRGKTSYARYARFSLLSLSRLSRFSPFPLPTIHSVWHNLITFYRAHTRVFVRHYSDRLALYRSRASHRYFLQLEFYTSRTSFPACGHHHHTRRFFNYCVLEWCCLPAVRYFFSSPFYASHHVVKSIDKYLYTVPTNVILMHYFCLSYLYNVYIFSNLCIYIYT